MLKKTIKFTDYNGVERTEDHYFNLNKAEVIMMEMSTAGGFAEHIKAIVKAKDTPTLIALFQDLILKSYGRKSPDGVGFEKSEAISNAFKCTEAYSELFVELATDTDAAIEFVNGIMPKPADNAKPATIEG